MKHVVVMGCVLALSLFACDEADRPTSVKQAEDTQTLPYMVLTQKDYTALTGCDVSYRYELIQGVLDYLVFFEGKDRENLAYVQREAIPLFNDLIKNGSDRMADAACLPDSLRRMGEEIGLLVSIHKAELDNSSTDGFDLGANPVRFDPDAGGFPDEQNIAYAVQSRREYMNSTGCLISPSSYGAFQAAFRGFFFDSDHPEKARIEMAAFLNDVRDSRPLPDGSINPQCLTPGLLKLGQDMGVLSESGKFVSADE